jgi:hypothetical protein
LLKCGFRVLMWNSVPTGPEFRIMEFSRTEVVFLSCFFSQFFF